MIVATRAQGAVATTIATTTPSKGNANSLLFLKDATFIVQNAVAAAFAATASIAPVFALTPVSAHTGADVIAAGLKTKRFNLDLSLKDNTQPQFPVDVSSLSLSSSSKTTTTGSAFEEGAFLVAEPAK